MKAVDEGYEAYILFVIQMSNVKYFEPNYETHKEFGDTLKIAKKQGVNIIAMECEVTPESIDITKEVKVIL